MGPALAISLLGMLLHLRGNYDDAMARYALARVRVRVRVRVRDRVTLTLTLTLVPG